MVEAIEAADAAQLTRLMIPIGAAACMGGSPPGLTTGAYHDVVTTVRPLLDHLIELPTPSIMASGLAVTYTEAAVLANAETDDRVAAIRHLGPVLQGDFNRLGLGLARIVQQAGHHELAVRAVGACTRTGRSTFSTRQIAAILDAARHELGDERVDRLLADGESAERSDLNREMWDEVQTSINTTR